MHLFICLFINDFIHSFSFWDYYWYIIAVILKKHLFHVASCSCFFIIFRKQRSVGGSSIGKPAGWSITVPFLQYAITRHVDLRKEFIIFLISCFCVNKIKSAVRRFYFYYSFVSIVKKYIWLISYVYLILWVSYYGLFWMLIIVCCLT